MIRALSTEYGILHIPDTDTAQFAWLNEAGISAEHRDIVNVQELLVGQSHGVVVDVGANFGCWTLALAPYAQQVLAFEPQRAVCGLLHVSVRANQLNNVIVFGSALGDVISHETMVDLDLGRPTNFGGLALDERNVDQPEAPARLVDVVPLDDCIGRHRHVSFIKVDTEGYELKVLRGADKTIWRCRPILFVETDHPRTDKEALLEHIAALNYAIDQRGPNALCLPL